MSKTQYSNILVPEVLPHIKLYSNILVGVIPKPPDNITLPEPSTSTVVVALPSPELIETGIVE